MTQRERDEFFVLLAKAMPQASLPMVLDAGAGLIRAAGLHLRGCEGDCSIPAPKGDEGDGMDVPGYWGRMKLRGLNLALKYCPDGWAIEHQNDPRGGTLWLQARGKSHAANWLRIYPPARGIPARVFDRS